MSSSDPEEDDEMAAFMGFSTFGKAPAAKKRKFNPATDSFVEGEELKKIDRGGKKGKGSGGNEVPLGRSRVIGTVNGNGNGVSVQEDGKESGVRNLGSGIGSGSSSSSRMGSSMGMGMRLPPPRVAPEWEEEFVPGEEEDGRSRGMRYLDTRRPAPRISPPREEEEGDDEGPRYMDTSLPPPRKALRGSPPREEEGDDGPRYMDTSLPPPTEGPAYMDTSLPPPISGPDYMDTSLPPPAAVYMDTNPPLPVPVQAPETDIDPIAAAEAAEMQERIDRIMASIQPPPGSEDLPSLPLPTPSSNLMPMPISIPTPYTSAPGYEQKNNYQSMGLPPKPVNGLPSRPPAAAGFTQNSRGGGASGGGGRGAGGRQRGERNEEWYVGYYDPAFNENPWERLEKEKGLESLGTWVERMKREVR